MPVRLATTLPSLRRDKFEVYCRPSLGARAPCVTRYVLEKKQSAWSEYSLCATLDLQVDVGSIPGKSYGIKALLFASYFILHFLPPPFSFFAFAIYCVSYFMV